MLISVSWDQTVRFWDILTGHQAPYLLEEAHDDYIWDVAYCAESDTFATASADKTVKVWSMATRALLGTLRGHGGEVFKVEWNPIHALWVSGGEDATVRTWTPVADGPQPVWTPKPKPVPEEGEPQPAAEGEEAESEEEEMPPDPLSALNTIGSREPVTALCLDKNSGYAVVASMDHYIRVYDLLACEVVAGALHAGGSRVF
jgi:WD40 repeat protein